MLQVTERNGRLYITGTFEGLRIRESTGLPVGQEKLAAEMRDRKMREIVDGRKKGPTVAEAVEMYVGRPEGMGQTAITYCERFAKSKWGKTRIGSLDMAEVYKTWAATPKARETIRRELGAVQAMLNWAAQAYNMDRKFHIKKPPKGDERLRFLEEDEVAAMVRFAPAWFRPVVVTFFQTGLRRSELAKLKWKDVKGDALLVPTKKGRSGRTRWRTIDLHPDVVRLMGPRGKPTEHVFYMEDGRTPWENDVTKINKVWGAVAEDAGVDDCIPHDARRTFASALLERGTDLRTIADLLGHTKLDLLMLYAQVRGKTRRESVGKLPSIWEDRREGQDRRAADARRWLDRGSEAMRRFDAGDDDDDDDGGLHGDRRVSDRRRTQRAGRTGGGADGRESEAAGDAVSEPAYRKRKLPDHLPVRGKRG